MEHIEKNTSNIGERVNTKENGTKEKEWMTVEILDMVKKRP